VVNIIIGVIVGAVTAMMMMGAIATSSAAISH
jgi:hypothetical protein